MDFETVFCPFRAWVKFGSADCFEIVFTQYSRSDYATVLFLWEQTAFEQTIPFYEL